MGEGPKMRQSGQGVCCPVWHECGEQGCRTRRPCWNPGLRTDQQGEPQGFRGRSPWLPGRVDRKQGTAGHPAGEEGQERTRGRREGGLV